jgi:hypothetical protein
MVDGGQVTRHHNIGYKNIEHYIDNISNTILLICSHIIPNTYYKHGHFLPIINMNQPIYKTNVELSNT